MLRRLPASVVAIVCLTLPAQAQPLTNPYEIFDRARSYWLQQHYPPLIEYDVAVRVLEGGTIKTQRYWSAYDSVDQRIVVDPISDYELAHPAHAAHGLTINIPLLSRLSKPQPPEDFLGVPELAPNYTFGMARIPPTNPQTSPDSMEIVRAIRAQFHDPNPRGDRTPKPSPAPSGLPIIEDVTAYNRAYHVTLRGMESIEGVRAYHLHLVAVRDPGKFRLQDLWVDAASYAPIELVECINFVTGPGTGVPWRVRFANAGGALYVYDETALRPMGYRGLLYPKASVSFENVHAADTLSRHAPLLLPHVPLIMREPPSS